MHKYILLSLSLISYAQINCRTSAHIEHELFHTLLHKEVAQKHCSVNNTTENNDPVEQQLIEKNIKNREALAQKIRSNAEARFANYDIQSILRYSLQIEESLIPLKKELIQEHDQINSAKNWWSIALVVLTYYGWKNSESTQADYIAIGLCSTMALCFQLIKEDTQPLVTSHEHSLYTVELLKAQIAQAEKQSNDKQSS